MITLTLDTNCIIDLEEHRENAACLKVIIACWEKKKIDLQVVGISASERTRNKQRPETFKLFKQKLAFLGLDDVTILKPIAYIGIGFIDWSLICDEAMLEEEKAIHKVLFPNIPFKRSDYCKHDPEDPKCQKWLNAKCDVQAIWSHIYHGGDIFVTSDNNFHKETKKSLLENMGAGKIAYPREAVQIINCKSADSQ